MSEEKKKNINEVQSKTVILDEVDGVDDMLSSLNTGREKLDEQAKKAHKKSLFSTKNIIIFVLLAIVVAEIIYLLLR